MAVLSSLLPTFTLSMVAVVDKKTEHFYTFLESDLEFWLCYLGINHFDLVFKLMFVLVIIRVVLLPLSVMRG